MSTQLIRTSTKYTVAFLLDKGTGQQLDLTDCEVSLTVTPQYVELGTRIALNRYDIDCSIYSRGGTVLVPSVLGGKWVLNVGQEENAFHIPLLLQEVGYATLFNKGELANFVGLGAPKQGIHNVGEYLRFDTGDGTYVELYMANPEIVTPKGYIERWYNKQRVWKW